MPHDVFDVYQTIIKDTNEMNARRRQLDSLYVALITFILTGEAYVAFYSAFTNWLLVFVTIGISLVGGSVTARWRDGLDDLDEVLNFRYEYLRNLEARDEMIAIGATLYGDEWLKIYKPREDLRHHANKRFRSVTKRLQLVFIIVFFAIPILLLCITALETIPLIHSLIPTQILPLIQPLVAPSRP
ncbi:MAG TPA: hypothetical protein VFU60_05680 [Ktedonobacterales bacterium]|jgi:hypothetical protein|nr:hypothetical protein [Ktedonobacterales bacterium]